MKKEDPKRATDLATTKRSRQDSQAAVERGSMMTQSEKKKVLRARAKTLAKEPVVQESRQDYLEVVEFTLASERYGIESSCVREVYLMKELTPVPCTPSFVLGITNVRGKILSVLDIKKFFDLPETGLGDRDRIIIVQASEMELGILVDAAHGVSYIPLEDIQPSLPTLSGIRQEYLKGIAKDRLVILDMNKFLCDQKIVVHEEIT